MPHVFTRQVWDQPATCYQLAPSLQISVGHFRTSSLRTSCGLAEMLPGRALAVGRAERAAQVWRRGLVLAGRSMFCTSSTSALAEGGDFPPLGVSYAGSCRYWRDKQHAPPRPQTAGPGKKELEPLELETLNPCQGAPEPHWDGAVCVHQCAQRPSRGNDDLVQPWPFGTRASGPLHVSSSCQQGCITACGTRGHKGPRSLSCRSPIFMHLEAVPRLCAVSCPELATAPWKSRSTPGASVSQHRAWRSGCLYFSARADSEVLP